MSTQPYRDHLVAEIEKRLAHTLAPDVRHAFLHTPRDLFVENYYEQQGNSRTWELILSPSLESVYRDEALTTLIDERGLPGSSSSLPSLMAEQLEALDIQQGHRLLEIGTGTGYNAALMSHMVGRTGQVVSIDIDEELISHAQMHIVQAGYSNVLALVGDGFAGEEGHMPYDRLLATCGVRAIPRPWLSQLRQAGVLISNVLLTLASIFVQLEKIDTTTLSGRLLPIEARYMEMRKPGSTVVKRGHNWKKYDALPHYDVMVPDNETELFKNTAYCLLLQCLLPGISKHYRVIDDQNQIAVYLLDHRVENAAVRVDEDRLVAYGHAESLAKQIRESMMLYASLGRPSIHEYTVSVVEQQARLHVGDLNFLFALIARE